MSEPTAYRVPFRLVSTDRDIMLWNASGEDLPWVRVEPSAGAFVKAVAPGSMGAGCVLRVRRASQARPDAALMVTWIRGDGEGPYIWRAVL